MIHAFCKLTVIPPSSINHIISGNFSSPGSNEFVLSFGKYLALARVNHLDTLNIVYSCPVFANITSLEKIHHKCLFFLLFFRFYLLISILSRLHCNWNQRVYYLHFIIRSCESAVSYITQF